MDNTQKYTNKDMEGLLEKMDNIISQLNDPSWVENDYKKQLEQITEWKKYITLVYSNINQAETTPIVEAVKKKISILNNLLDAKLPPLPVPLPPSAPALPVQSQPTLEDLIYKYEQIVIFFQNPGNKQKLLEDDFKIKLVNVVNNQLQQLSNLQSNTPDATQLKNNLEQILTQIQSIPSIPSNVKQTHKNFIAYLQELLTANAHISNPTKLPQILGRIDEWSTRLQQQPQTDDIKDMIKQLKTLKSKFEEQDKIDDLVIQPESTGVLNYPEVIIRTKAIRLCMFIILVLMFVTNVLILKQVYTDDDREFKNVSKPVFNTMVSFLVIVFTMVAYIIRNYYFYAPEKKAIMFVVFIVWVILPMSMLVSKNVSDYSTFLMVNAWISVFFSIFGALWFLLFFVFGKITYVEETFRATNKCQNVGGFMDLNNVFLKYEPFQKDGQANLTFCDPRTGQKEGFSEFIRRRLAEQV